MSLYLVIAHQTADSTELREALDRKQRDDSEAEFVLLVPSTPQEHLINVQDGQPRDVARRAAARAAEQLRAGGLKLRWTVVSDEQPAVALETEIQDHPGTYTGVIISTFPRGISQWLESYMLQSADKFGLPVEHIVAASPSKADN